MYCMYVLYGCIVGNVRTYACMHACMHACLHAYIYLSNRQQYVSINGRDSSKVVMNYGVPQGSVLGPLMFLIYINDLHKSIKYCNVRHFADDTNLLINDNSPKQIQDQVNSGLKH